MGYLLSSKIRISELSKFKPLHEISSLTNLVALESVKNIKFMVNIQQQVLKNKKYFLSRINNFFETIDTKTNFILIKIPNSITSKELISYYNRNKILMREPFEQGILKDYSRITIGTKYQIDKFVNITKELFKKLKNKIKVISIGIEKDIIFEIGRCNDYTYEGYINDSDLKNDHHFFGDIDELEKIISHNNEFKLSVQLVLQKLEKLIYSKFKNNLLTYISDDAIVSKKQL